MLWQRPISPTVEHGTLWSMHLSLDNQSLDRCEAHHGCRPKQGMMQELCSLICRTFSQSASEVPFTAIHFTPAFVAALIKLGAVSSILLSCKWQCTSKSGVLVIAIAMAFQAYSATLPSLPSFPSSFLLLLLRKVSSAFCDPLFFWIDGASSLPLLCRHSSLSLSLSHLVFSLRCSWEFPSGEASNLIEDFCYFFACFTSFSLLLVSWGARATFLLSM